jgi:hypothetical protein
MGVGGVQVLVLMLGLACGVGTGDRGRGNGGGTPFGIIFGNWVEVMGRLLSGCCRVSRSMGGLLAL